MLASGPVRESIFQKCVPGSVRAHTHAHEAYTDGLSLAVTLSLRGKMTGLETAQSRISPALKKGRRALTHPPARPFFLGLAASVQTSRRPAGAAVRPATTGPNGCGN